MELARGVLGGVERAIARAISLAEARRSEARELLSILYPHTGSAYIVGVTGAPGTGKSTLVNQLARAYRQRDVRVGIIGVDPSSPFSGGALGG
jgi:LAO/AO transport system kinase